MKAGLVTALVAAAGIAAAAVGAYGDLHPAF
jgi:hypothetical protein